MPSAAVFSSDLVKEHSSYSAGGLAAIKLAVNSKCTRQIRDMRDTYVEIYKKMG